MLRIPCPWCGLRDEHEFAYGGDATVVRPKDSARPKVWYDAVYTRANPCGEHTEYWQHIQGCRAWIRVVRDTRTNKISAAEPTGQR